jgi:ketosteroid isomerase-like protein
MSIEEANAQWIQQMFAAFDRGDIPTVLGMVADDADWQSPVIRAVSEEVPWARPRQGRGEVAAFFRELNEQMQIEKMETGAYTAQGDRVVVEGKNRGTVRATGRSYEHDWVMVFTMRQGQIVRMRHYYDTADILAAIRG